MFPKVVVTGLVVSTLDLMPDLRRAADGPTIAVSGERFWWRIAYDPRRRSRRRPQPARGRRAERKRDLAALGRRTEILLSSPDVIHSGFVSSALTR